MTIRGTRQAAAGVAVAGAGLSVFLSVIAFLIGTPQLILGVGAFVVVFAFSAAMLTLPVSLGLEADEVVYRSGRSERRYPRREVASCRLAQSGSRAGWIFSNQAGSRMFALNAWRFQDTEVAAFCTRAGIAWNGPSMRRADRLGRDVRSARWLIAVGGVVGILFLIFSGLAAWTQATVRDDLARYLAAPACTQGGAPTAGCRLQTEARVTSVDAGQYSATLHVTLVPGGGDYRTRLALPAPSVGDVVAVEVWSGRVTRVTERDTTDNPKDNPNLSINGVIAGFVLFAAANLGLAVLGWFQLRTARARLRRSDLA